MQLNNEQKAIINHTIENELFCGGSEDMDELCELGFMKFVGHKPFVPDPYYRVTDLGREEVDNDHV